MKKIAASNPKPVRWRRKTLLALFAATAALAGGAQALAPAPAGAVINEGEECPDLWSFECGEANEGGGGGPEGGWGSPEGPDREQAEQAIQERAEREDAEREARWREEAQAELDGKRAKEVQDEEEKDLNDLVAQLEREFTEDPARIAEEIMARIRNERSSFESELAAVEAECGPIVGDAIAAEEAGQTLAADTREAALGCISELNFRRQRFKLEGERLEREETGPVTISFQHEAKWRLQRGAQSPAPPGAAPPSPPPGGQETATQPNRVRRHSSNTTTRPSMPSSNSKKKHRKKAWRQSAAKVGAGN